MPRSDVVHERFRSSDRAEIEQYIRTRYVDLRIEPADDGEPFSCEFTTTADSLLSISRVRVTGTLVSRRQQLEDRVLVYHCRQGSLGWNGSPYGDVRAGPGDVVLAPPSCESGFADEADVDLVSLDAVALAHYAADTCGIDPDALRFTGLSPISQALERYWLGVVAHVGDAVLTADPMITTNGLALDSAFRGLATALIATFPNTARVAAGDQTLTSSDRSVPDTAPARVPAYRKAGAGIGKASTMLFRDPGRVLWETRLRGVRRDLVDTGPGGTLTVADLAARWGFRLAGPFRTVYAREFGESPEHTFGR